jgi:hypothetical protein
MTGTDAVSISNIQHQPLKLAQADYYQNRSFMGILVWAKAITR